MGRRMSNSRREWEYESWRATWANAEDRSRRDVLINHRRSVMLQSDDFVYRFFSRPDVWQLYQKRSVQGKGTLCIRNQNNGYFANPYETLLREIDGEIIKLGPQQSWSPTTGR